MADEHAGGRERTKAEPVPAYELFALRYATNPRRRRRENFQPPHDRPDAPMPMDFFCWVASSADRLVLIDAGADEATCRARGLDFLRSPVDALAALGRRAEEVTDVVLTHLHWDHAGNLERFTNARFHVHPEEIAHVTGPAMLDPAARRVYEAADVCALVRLLHAGRVDFTGSDHRIAPGLTAHHVGGHTPGLQVARVHAARGWVVLASDALYYFENQRLGVPPPLVANVGDYLAALRRIAALASSPEHVVPGHDSLLREMYPTVGDGAALRLDATPHAPATEGST